MDDFLARFGTDEEKKAANIRLGKATPSMENTPATANAKPETHPRKNLAGALASIQPVAISCTYAVLLMRKHPLLTFTQSIICV